MDLNQLRILLAVVETSSVTRAAERVGLSPGAVSQQMHALSQRLRTELFVKSGKRIVPTPGALRLAVHASAVLQQVRIAEREFENEAGADTRPFHFATGATTLIYRLGPPLRQIRKRFPETEMHVTVAATEEILEGVHMRRFDLGLLSLPVPENHVSLMPLYEEELLGLRPAQRESSGGKVVSLQPEELKDKPFLLYPRRSNMRTVIDQFFHSVGLSPHVVMEADDTEVIKRLVESGFGYAILPEHALRRQNRFFELFRIAGHRLARRQALAMPRTEFPRTLTLSVARVIQSALA